MLLRVKRREYDRLGEVKMPPHEAGRLRAVPAAARLRDRAVLGDAILRGAPDAGRQPLVALAVLPQHGLDVEQPPRSGVVVDGEVEGAVVGVVRTRIVAQ